MVPEHAPPGPLVGGALGVGAGLLLAGVWEYGAADVALALSLVFAGLAAVLLAGAPRWRSFATGLVAATVVVGGVLLLVAA